MSQSAKWYLLQCKPQQQARAQWHLDQQGFECYTPQHQIKRVVREKVVTRSEVLFPGYLFIKLNLESNWRSLRATRGVSKVVSFNGMPQPVNDSIIVALKHRLSETTEPAPLYTSGDRVLITQGCFKDIEAIVQSVRADERIVVLMKIMQTEQAIQMTPAQLAKAS